MTLTAAFSFDNNKFPIASSRNLEERLKQRSSLGSFRVEEPPLNGPIRDTHELVLSYIRQENPAYYDRSKKLQGNSASEKQGENRQTDNLLKSTPTASKYYLDDLDTSQISSTFPPERGTKRLLTEESISNTNQFRIVVPSTTPDYSLTEEVTIRPKLSQRRGNNGNLNPTGSTTTSYETVKPYKLPLLTRESIESLSLKQILPQSQQTTEQFQRSRIADHTDSSNLPYRKRNMNESRNHESIGLFKGSSEVTRGDTFKFVSLRGTNKTLLQGASRSHHNIHNNGTAAAVLHNIPSVNHVNKKTNVSIEQSNTSPFQDNRQYLKGISTTEESILKLIPIKTVRSRLQSQAEDVLFDSKYDPVTATSSVLKKEYDNYQVTEDNEDFENIGATSVVGRSRYQPQISQENLLRSQGNSPNYRKKLNEEPIYTTTSNYDRIRSRLSQPTKIPPIQKQIYSLTINDEQVKQSNKGGDILLATLETITNIPINSENNPKQHSMTSSTKEVPNLQTTNINQNASHRIVSHNVSQHQSSDHIERASYTNQIRMRNRTRPSILTNVYSDRKLPIPLDSTTERNENEAVTSVQVKFQLKSRQREEQLITEKPLIEDHQQLKKTTQETGNKEKESFLTPNTESDIRYKWSADGSSNINSKYNSQPVADQNLDQRRRQFKQKNRLITFQDNEDEISHPPKDTADIDSQEEIDFYTKQETANTKENQTVNKNKGRTESYSVLKTKVQFENTRSETIPTTAANTVESATFENDSDLSGEIIQERQQNVRKMHIRKKIRVTPVKAQSTTQSYDDTYNTYYSKSSKTTLDVEEQPSLAQFTENESINYDDNSRSNLVAVTPGFTVPKTRGPLGYRSNHKENEHSSLESVYNQVEEKGAHHFKLNSQNPAIDPYALLRSSWPKTNELSGKNNFDEQVTLQTEKPVIARNRKVETKPMSPIAIEINSYFNEGPQNLTVPPTTVIYTKAPTTPFPLTTAERIKDKFRLGSFPKPAPPSNSYVRKPSVEDSTPPPLPSDRCSQELDNESECNEKTLLR